MALYVGSPDGTLLTAALRDTDHREHDTNLIVAVNSSRVLGLVGANNTGTPNTQVDLRADAIVFQSATGLDLPVVRAQAATLTNNISTAGPAANGRDQSAAFTNNSFLYFYFIWNGTTVATLSSATAPPTGPTLPSGYTHWAFATTRRYTTVLLRQFDRGCWVHYGTFQTLLNASGATVETALSSSSRVPAHALLTQVQLGGAITSSSGGGGEVFLAIRVYAGGADFGTLRAYASTASVVFNSTETSQTVPNVGQNFFYIVGLSGSVSTRSVAIAIQGYSVPNGG